jgi:hypothetical protein
VVQGCAVTTSARRASRILVALGLALGSLSISPATATAALHGRKFQMPSGNIGCLLHSGVLRCDILSGLNPEPERDCDVDWTGLSLDSDGKASPVCAGDTVMDRDARTLKYGHKWKRNGITCTSRRSGLRCHNRKHHGFFLSRDDWDTF